MRKADLVSKLRDRFLEDFALRSQDPRLIPLGQMTDLARLCRAGGQMRVVSDEVGLDGVLPPIPFPPYVNYFRDGKDYLAVLPDEYGEAFRDADFDGLLDEARQVAEACDYLAMATDMRGLILLDEACEGIAERFDFLDADDVRRLIEKDMTSPAMELDGKTYVCADDLIDWDERAQEYALERGIARKILEERVGHDPYWPSREEAAYKSVLRMAESLDEGRELLSYVQNHVPDGEDDLTFPTWILSEIVDMSINPLDPQEAVDTFTDILNDIAFNEPQAKRVAPLIMNLSKKLPRRSLNGYSPERFDEVRPDAPRNIVFLRSSR